MGAEAGKGSGEAGEISPVGGCRDDPRGPRSRGSCSRCSWRSCPPPGGCDGCSPGWPPRARGRSARGSTRARPPRARIFANVEREGRRRRGRRGRPRASPRATTAEGVPTRTRGRGTTPDPAGARPPQHPRRSRNRPRGNNSTPGETPRGPARPREEGDACPPPPASDAPRSDPRRFQRFFEVTTTTWSLSKRMTDPIRAKRRRTARATD